MKQYIGAHLSVGKGYEDMVDRAVVMGANTFAFFLRNPRGGSARALDVEDLEKAREKLEKYEFGPLVAHAPYTMNPAGSKESVLAFADIAMREDLDRLEYLPGSYYNFHPGSHVGQGIEKGITFISEYLKRMLDRPLQTTVLLETMAGKGTEVGSCFEELATIIKNVDKDDSLGVCLDTCHIHEAGYDLKDIDGILQEFDEIIGLQYLNAIHLNDSKNPRGARKDRHELLGEGEIGWDSIINVLTHPQLRHLPFILETPQETEEGYGIEIAELRERSTHILSMKK
ncbi:MAG: deoxyribonuclease IV [Clostridiaceae bacterium]|nr:deoxyribonuclease IV [Clostridiaceae bacterium]